MCLWLVLTFEPGFLSSWLMFWADALSQLLLNYHLIYHLKEVSAAALSQPATAALALKTRSQVKCQEILPGDLQPGSACRGEC